MAATQRDVANAAGVSVASVSRVLSGARNVSPTVEAAVREASQRLGYRGDAVARALRTRTTKTVGMVVPVISNPFFPSLVQAVERRLDAAGHQLFLCDSEDDPEVERRRIEALLERRIDGLVVIPCVEEQSRPAVVAASRVAPVVQIDRRVRRATHVDYVGIDNEAGIIDMVEHLLATGSRTFAFIGAQPTSSTAHDRLDAFRRCADRYPSADLRPTMLGDYSATWGRIATVQLLESGAELPHALVCGNDLLALGALQELHARGVAVPDAVRVTGFDDAGLPELAVPPLTSVRQPLEQLGTIAAELLLRRLDGDEAPAKLVLLKPELVVRESSGGRS